MAQFLRSTFHWPEEPGAHQGTWHLSGAAILATVMLDTTNTCFKIFKSPFDMTDQYIRHLTSSCRSGVCTHR